MTPYNIIKFNYTLCSFIAFKRLRLKDPILDKKKLTNLENLLDTEQIRLMQLFCPYKVRWNSACKINIFSNFL